jgi:hypothetical protein
VTAPRRQNRFGLAPGKLPWVALLCLALVTLLAFVQVAHFHTNDADSSTCTLCVTMQTVVPAAVMTAAILVVSLGRATKSALVPAPIRRSVARHRIRPPPAR